ncbi:PIN-like domain-containing protein [Paraburkholderia sp. WSM4175]|uniref:PIN-like domain-containing protein n=1 Tax=Paraburkholderia sp. WSM4175 TaxID=2991072 RepID=UPI003D257C56
MQIQAVGDRVRVPYQVAEEFFRNRVTVIGEQRRAYREVLNAAQSAKETIEKAISKHDRKNGLLNADHLRARLAVSFQPFIDEVAELQKTHPDLLANEDFRVGRVGATARRKNSAFPV